MTNTEGQLLESIDDSKFAGKGMCFSLENGRSGYDVSHWHKLVFTLSKQGDLCCQTYEDARAGRPPTLLLNVQNIAEVNRTSFGVVVPFGVTIDVTRVSKKDKDDPPVTIGFYSREEQGLWIEDMDNTFKEMAEAKLLKMQAEHERSAEAQAHKPLDLSEKHLGRTQAMLEELSTQHDQKKANIGNVLASAKAKKVGRLCVSPSTPLPYLPVFSPSFLTLSLSPPLPLCLSFSLLPSFLSSLSLFLSFASHSNRSLSLSLAQDLALQLQCLYDDKSIFMAFAAGPPQKATKDIKLLEKFAPEQPQTRHQISRP